MGDADEYYGHNTSLDSYRCIGYVGTDNSKDFLTVQYV